MAMLISGGAGMGATRMVFGVVGVVAAMVLLADSFRGLWASSAPAPPPLNNPQNPVKYGGDPTGISNSAPAFQSAINAGDLDVPAGLFRIDGTVLVPSNRNIRCEARSALKYTTTGNIAMFEWRGSTGGSVFNCHFRGNNYDINGKPGTSYAFQEFLLVQSVGGKGGGLIIANNDFNGIGGWIAAIQLYGSDVNQPGPQSDLITQNSFEHCGLYALQLTSGRYNTISYNILTDCAGFVEADDSGQENTGNIIDHNTLMFVFGIGQWGPGLPAYNELTCGAAPIGFNYSGNTCSNNVVSGSVRAPSHIVQSISDGMPAKYVNNACSQSCSVM